MEALDPAEEWRHLLERYRQMSDDELLALAWEKCELTDVAQQTLAQEIFQRRLKLPPRETSAPPEPGPQPDSPYAEDRELVEICTVWSLSDAFQLQTLLDRAGIPFFMGPEKAESVDTVTSNLVNGVSVQIMRIGLPWAHQALRDYTPTNEPSPTQEEEHSDLPVCCPKCHSAEVIFERLITEPTTATDDSPPKFEWTCDSCGHEWEDDGTAKK
jgi:DNA-directed RNA polymerase subunit M/transcription elongation factor TFIIS